MDKYSSAGRGYTMEYCKTFLHINRYYTEGESVGTGWTGGRAEVSDCKRVVDINCGLSVFTIPRFREYIFPPDTLSLRPARNGT